MLGCQLVVGTVTLGRFTSPHAVKPCTKDCDDGTEILAEFLLRRADCWIEHHTTHPPNRSICHLTRSKTKRHKQSLWATTTTATPPVQTASMRRRKPGCLKLRPEATTWLGNWISKDSDLVSKGISLSGGQDTCIDIVFAFGWVRLVPIIGAPNEILERLEMVHLTLAAINAVTSDRCVNARCLHTDLRWV